MQPSKDFNYSVDPTFNSWCQLSNCIHEVRKVAVGLKTSQATCGPEIARLEQIERAYTPKNTVLSFVTDEQLQKVELYINDGYIDHPEVVFQYGLDYLSVEKDEEPPAVRSITTTAKK